MATYDYEMTSMRPSAVRKRIQSEHDELRTQLDKLEALAERLGQDDGAAVEPAIALSQDLYETLRDHIDLEDAILAPALREADAWGDLRADKLVAHHREQREELMALGNDIPSGVNPRDFGERLRAFILDVREDMKHEEKALLDENLLRDDVIGIDVDPG